MDTTPVLMMFPGQGAQHARMAVGLYRYEPAFTEAVDAVFAAFGPRGAALRSDWLAGGAPTVPLDDVSRSQPLLFAVDYALGWMLTAQYGVRPSALLGHSVGEMAASVLAGIFTLEDAADLLLDRVDRISAAPPGGMLAVAAGAEEVQPYLVGDVVVAAENSPQQTIVAGPSAPLGAVADVLRHVGLAARPVPSLTAFHSPCLSGVVAGAAERFVSVPVAAPRLPVYSGYRPGRLTGELASDPSYWAGHPVEKVLFWPALDTVLNEYPGVLCVEVGPGRGLGTIARRHPRIRSGNGGVVSLLPARPGAPEADRDALAAALSTLREHSAPRPVIPGDGPPGAPVPG